MSEPIKADDKESQEAAALIASLEIRDDWTPIEKHIMLSDDRMETAKLHLKGELVLEEEEKDVLIYMVMDSKDHKANDNEFKNQWEQYAYDARVGTVLAAVTKDGDLVEDKDANVQLGIKWKVKEGDLVVKPRTDDVIIITKKVSEVERVKD